MVRELRVTYAGALYHVFSKGDKDEYIFDTDRQKGYFAGTFIKAIKRCEALLHAFCIMGNHYHLLVRTPKDNLPELMHFIGSAYASYFQRERGVPGHVFNGRYKSLIVETNLYVLALTRYIHQNPVRAGIAGHPIEYRWSSYRFFADGSRLPNWLDRSLILEQLDRSPRFSLSEYRDFVERSLDPESLETEAMAFDRALASGEKSLEVALTKQRDLNELARIISGYYSSASLSSIRSRQAFIYLARIYSDVPNKAIAEMLGTVEGNISYHFHKLGTILESGNSEAPRWILELNEIIEFWGLTPESKKRRGGA